MAKYIYTFILLLILALFTTSIIAVKRAKHYHELYDIECSNVRAYELENSDLKNSRYMLELSIAQLQESKDTINQKLLETVKTLNIKEKKLKQLQYQSSIATRVDTVVLTDTIFKDSTLILDSCVSDEWYNMCISLRYPSTIIVNPTFKSEKSIVVSKKREFVKPPSKCFFVRWFQKKHTVIAVDIVEKNPYIENTESRFINVVKK